MGIKQWRLPDISREEANRLSAETGLHPLVCTVLLARGIRSGEEMARFVREDSSLDDPTTLPDMEPAVQRIRQAMEDGERIAVYGDYDCDGITSTALLTSYFQSVGADVVYYVPGRETEGYGLNNSAVDTLHGQGVGLIVTVDNGISAHEEVAYAKTLGIDVVITDHHTPRDTLPDAVAVVDPHRKDWDCSYRDLAGVGVAFKLICALEDDHGEELLEYYSDLVAIGTVADIVPLTGENRVIVRHGLARLSESERPGVQALLAASGLQDRELGSESVSFGIAPRINAAGRMGVADDVIEMLLTDDLGYAAEMAAQLNEQNAQRKATEEKILAEIQAILDQRPQILRERVLLIAGSGWHHGVVGIAAARMVERYQKPCILFSIEDGEARGSGRGVTGFNMIEAITACREGLSRFGGHAMAAGLTLPQENLEDFSRRLLEHVKERYEIMPLPTLHADCVLTQRDLQVESIAALKRLEPFGAGNESPLFCLQGLTIEGIYPTSDQKHIRIRFQSGTGSFYAVWFGMSAARFPYQTGETVDIMAKISVSEYNGKDQLSVKISDLRLGGVPQEDVLRFREYHSRYLRGEDLPDDLAGRIVPGREEIGAVYRYLRGARSYPYSEDDLYLRLMRQGLTYCQMRVAVDVLVEMGFLLREGEGLRLVPDAPKADLSQSTILSQLAAHFPAAATTN